MAQEHLSSNMKNILVISFNCFEESSSNGRALGSLFKLIENEINISQIFIKQGKPDMMSGKYCFIDEYKLFKNFFSINRSASFFSVDLSSERKELADDNFAFKSIHKEIKKTPFKMMCRNIVWSLASLNTKSIIKWSKNIKPDYVVLQAGDLPFLYKLSIKIAKANHSSLVFYTSENYPFKKTNYVDLKKKSVCYNQGFAL